MATYISILRGINVSGHRMIKMEAIRQLYVDMNCRQVQSYIQSGNIIFKHQKVKPQELEKEIKKNIFKSFKLDVPVLVIEYKPLKQIIEGNPFIKDSAKNTAYLHITFLSSKPGNDVIEKLEKTKYPPNDFRVSDKAVYLYCPNGYSNCKLTNNFIENKLKVTVTTRNWKTAFELYSMAKKMQSLNE
jgi:uncharacterized protein (DUF1697 family)